MKDNKQNIPPLWLLLFLCITSVLVSCDKEDDTLLIVTDVRSQSFTDDEHLNTIKPGEMVRIQGTGLSTLKRVYANGIEVTALNPNFITDTQIIMQLPSSLPVDDELEDKTYMNSMRFVGANNEYIFSIRITK